MQLNSYFTSFGRFQAGSLSLNVITGENRETVTINTFQGGVPESYTIQIEPNSGRSAADDAEYLRGIFFPALALFY